MIECLVIFGHGLQNEVLSDGSPVEKTELKTGEAPYKAVFL